RWRSSPCSYAMVVEKSRYVFSTPDLYGDTLLLESFPVVLDFAIVGNASCPAKGQRPPPDYACASSNSYCVNATVGLSGYALSYVCKCSEHYEGNPYIANGCRDIDECKFPDLYYCSSKGICKNRPGGYDCPCKPGMRGDGKLGQCVEKFPLVAKAVVGYHWWYFCHSSYIISSSSPQREKEDQGVLRKEWWTYTRESKKY
uniref:EGF-like domain-containing protein n=1 Tax=Aegilops tauschii subsp. strangulata TaxID=200361 RepID=A0A453M4P4_AEGTS